MRNLATFTDRLLLRLWRTRAVQGLVLAGAAWLLQMVRRRGGSTLNFGFESPPVLDALDRFVRRQGAGPRVVDMPARPVDTSTQTPPDSRATDTSPVEPPPST